MDIHVNGGCIGCGLCVNLCPSVFTMTQEGTAAAKDAVYPEEEDQACEAAENCPVSAIEVS